jgi:hypothetical protein
MTMQPCFNMRETKTFVQQLRESRMSFKEQLFEGKYRYLKDDQEYSEENFKIYHEEKAQGNFFINAELLSRVSTGEFLKIYIDYELTPHLEPLNLTIRRSLGRRQSVERFNVNHKEHLVKYMFRGDQSEGTHEKVINGKFFISAPCMCTSMLMTMSKKIDPVHRTQYAIVTTNNIWSYEGPFAEKMVYVEQMQSEPVGLKINGKDLNSTLIHLYQHDKTAPVKEKGIPFYLSKHMNMPYRARMDDNVVVEVEFLKHTESKYKGLF